MKIFAVYLRVKLNKKPHWFDEFIARYLRVSMILHVTLIQPRYISEQDISDIKLKIADVLNTEKFTGEDKKISFDKLMVDREENGKYVFMLNAKYNSHLISIQKELQLVLNSYKNYCDDVTIEYETNFKPHITVGVDVDPNLKEEAEKYFSTDYTCEGEITELVLPIVKHRSNEEADNINNLTIFNL